MSKLQNEDFKTLSQLTGAGGSASQLLNDTKIYVTANSLNKQLSQAITDGDIGGGSGGAKNYVSNSTAKTDTTGYAAYADAAASRPVDGTGGSPNITWSRVTSNPLSGVASFQLVKDAANRQGQGVSCDFTIDREDMAKVLSFSFYYEIVSGTYSGGTPSTDSDLIAYIYDVTNSRLIEPVPIKLDGGVTGVQYKYTGSFQSSSDSSSYRLIVHVATTSASAYTINFDDFVVSPSVASIGSYLSDWIPYTPTGSWVTNTTYTGFYQISGDSLSLKIKVATSGAPTSASLTVNLPTGFVIDTTKMVDTVGNVAAIDGVVSIRDVSSDSLTGIPRYNNTTSIIIFKDDGDGTVSVVNQASPMTWAAGDYADIVISGLPIVGKGTSQVLSSETDTRVVAAIITGDPASATVGNPIIVPTVTEDTHKSYNNTTGRYTVPIAGFYKMFGALQSASAATTLSIYKNASLYALCGNLDSNGEGTFSGMVKCNAGDLIDIRPGGTVDATSMVLNIERVSGPSQVVAAETVSCRYTNTAGTSITNSGADTNVPFATKDFDTHNAWNGTQFVVPMSGKYAVDGLITYGNLAWTAGNQIYPSIYKNGSLHSYGQIIIMPLTNTYTYGMDVSNTVNCVAGDTIEIRASNNRTAGATALNTAAGANSITITRVGN